MKSKKVKEIINNIKTEQKENRLNWEQKADDWEERYISIAENLEETTKQLEIRIKQGDFEKKLAWEGYHIVLAERDEKIRVLEEELEEKDESKLISLLKEQHEKEIRELKRNKEFVDKNLCILSKKNSKDKENLDKLEKELEKKKLLIENLEKEVKDAWYEIETHFGAIEFSNELQKAEVDKLSKKIGILENAGNEVLAQLDKEYKKNKSQKEYIDQLEAKLYGQEKLLRKELEKNTSQKVEVENLQRQVSLTNKLYLNNKLLPKAPSKFRTFKEKIKNKLQNLIEKNKQQSQKLFARIEVRVK